MEDLTKLKESIEYSFDLCLNYPFLAYDKQEFDYFYHLIEQADEITYVEKLIRSKTEQDFINWYLLFKANHNF